MDMEEMKQSHLACGKVIAHVIKEKKLEFNDGKITYIEVFVGDAG